MTLATPLPSSLSSAAPWRPVREAEVTLVDQLVAHLAGRIEERAFRPGARLPSIRDMAVQMGLSRYTVVEAYDRLVAQGNVESRRGAGFFVRMRAGALEMGQDGAAHTPPATPSRLDIAWLLNGMFGSIGEGGVPGGAGLLPAAWLDTEMVGAAMRAVGRSMKDQVAQYGRPRGYAPLRQQIASLLQAEGVPAHPDRNLLTCSGVTHGLDLLMRQLLRPGDTVLVEDPAWFVIFGRLAAFGVRMLGVPRRPDGPDIEVLERLAQAHKPKLFLINSVVHNPTGHTLSAGAAYDILRIAERHDFLVIEDDTYGDLHPGGAIRLAALDRLDRVILVGGYSKTLAASLRVGYVAARADLIDPLTDIKMLSGLTSPEMNERVVYRILIEGNYRRSLDRVRARVDQARQRCLKDLMALGFKIEVEPSAGMFVWADCGGDGEVLARMAAERGLLLAPGSLFSPGQAPSGKLRFSVVMAEHPQSWQALAAVMRDARPGSQRARDD
jgi:DNA-binding transcriptional MocR family regulator